LLSVFSYPKLGVGGVQVEIEEDRSHDCSCVALGVGVETGRGKRGRLITGELFIYRRLAVPLIEILAVL